MSESSQAVEPARRPSAAAADLHSLDCQCPQCKVFGTGEVQLREPRQTAAAEPSAETREQEQNELRERARARIRAMSEDSRGSHSPELLREVRARAQPQQACGYRGVVLDNDHARMYSHSELVDRLEEAWQKGKRHGECWAFPDGFAEGYNRAIDNVAAGSGYDRVKVVAWTGAGDPGPKRRRVA